jgi:hypothetical protein
MMNEVEFFELLMSWVKFTVAKAAKRKVGSEGVRRNVKDQCKYARLRHSEFSSSSRAFACHCPNTWNLHVFAKGAQPHSQPL